MQFGRKGSDEGSRGHGGNSGARRAAARGGCASANLGVGGQPQCCPQEATGGSSDPASSGNLCRRPSAAESGERLDGSGPCLWVGSRAVPLQRWTAMGIVRLAWTNRGAEAVWRLQGGRPPKHSPSPDSKAARVRSHQRARHPGRDDGAGAAGPGRQNRCEAIGADARPGLQAGRVFLVALWQHHHPETWLQGSGEAAADRP